MNKNSIKDDKSAISPSGIRIGMCAITTRGFKNDDCKTLSEFIHIAITIGSKCKSKKLVDFKNELDTNFINEINSLKNNVFNFSKKFRQL